jgi:predicted DNA-binding transcriptional regulator AlpA
MNTPNSKRHLRPPEAAEYIGFSQSKLAKLRVHGGGPVFIKAGRLVLYDVEDLNAWLAERRRTSTSDGGAS